MSAPATALSGQRSAVSLAAARLVIAELLAQFRADVTGGLDWDAATARLNDLYGRELTELLAWATAAAERQPIEQRYRAAVQRALAAARDEVLAKLGGETEAGSQQSEVRSQRPAESGRAAQRSTLPLSTSPVFNNAALANAGGVAADFNFDLDRLKAHLGYELRTVAASTLQEVGTARLAALGRDDVFTMPPARTVRFLRERANRLEHASQEIWDHVRGELEAGFSAGESTAKIAERITEDFLGLSRGRAEVIAQTEASAAYGVANDEALRQADGGSGRLRKRWLTSGLPNTRDSHLQAERDSAEGIPLDDAFSNGLMFPGDDRGEPEEVINCRCTLVSVEVDG